MIIELVTDAQAYFNDMAEEIRLFFGVVEVSKDAVNADLRLNISLTPERKAKGRLMPAGISCEIEVSPDGGDPLERKRQEKRALKLAAYTLLRGISEVETPWGSLTGIRPTKLYRELERRHGTDGAERQFREVFGVSEPKLALAREICAVQGPAVSSAKPDSLDVYIGIPYCKSRCLYCSFGAEVAKRDGTLDAYVAALIEDICAGADIARQGGFRLRAMYMGGGTPTVLSAEQLDRVLSAAIRAYGGFGTELTVEAGRPDTITREKLEVIKAHGAQRVCVNPQTMNDVTLERIGRFHSSAAIEEAYALVRAVGIANINMDIIAGLPGENVPMFQNTLERVKALRPENLTVHTLAIKRSSRLKERLDEYPIPPAKDVEAMLELGELTAREMGMRPYYMYRQKYMQGNLENVGYAKPDAECLYNIDIMEETVSIMAHGAGAMSKRVFPAENRVERIPNPKDVPTYKNKLPQLFAAKRQLFV